VGKSEKRDPSLYRIFLMGFNAICIEIRDILPEIGYVSLDFKLVHKLSRLGEQNEEMEMHGVRLYL
jgi:hypothetical protein